MPDPAAVEGGDAQAGAFIDTFAAMKRRLEVMPSPPMDSLPELRKALTDISKS